MKASGGHCFTSPLVENIIRHKGHRHCLGLGLRVAEEVMENWTSEGPCYVWGPGRGGGQEDSRKEGEEVAVACR